jgi:hypothetical protein
VTSTRPAEPGYGLVIEHDCDEELVLSIRKRSMLGPHAIPVDLTEQEAAKFRQVEKAWREWQDKLADAYDKHGDEERCGTCHGTGVRQEVAQ